MKFEAKVTYELIDAEGMKNDCSLWSYMKWLPKMIQDKGNTITALSVCRVGFLYKFEYADGSLHEGFSALVSPRLVKYFKRVDPVVIEARIEVPPKEEKSEVIIDYFKFLEARKKYKSKILDEKGKLKFPPLKELKADYDALEAKKLRDEHTAELMDLIWAVRYDTLKAFYPEKVSSLDRESIKNRFSVMSNHIPMFYSSKLKNTCSGIEYKPTAVA